MTNPRMKKPRFSERDLDFVVEEVAPEFGDKEKLKRLIVEDDDFRKGLVGHEKVFRKIVSDDEIFLKVSPTLYFEVLLRKALAELEKASHTFERAGTQAIPVFDTKEVVDLLARQPVLDYLVDMLASFTRIESYVIPVRVRKGIWRKTRFNDMDVDSLARMCEVVDEEQKFSFYKRIADVCLFVLGIFPEYAYFDYRYPSSGQLRPPVAGRLRRSAGDYEEEGRRFYKLAAEHQSARILDLSEVFWLLHGEFNVARKPLSFIAERYLDYKKHKLFPSEA